MAPSQRKTVIDSKAILNHIEKTQKIIQQIQNEFNCEQDECMIILGPSRTGKTTLFLMLQGIIKLEIAKMGKYIIREVQNDPSKVQQNYPKIDHEDIETPQQLGKISEQNQSYTEDPEYYVIQLENGRKLLVWDTPGFGDSKGITQDIKNGYSIERLFHSFKKIKILFAIPYSAFELLNKIADEALTQLLSSFKNFSEIQKNISFVITKMIHDYDTSKEFQEHQLKNNILNKQMDQQLKSLYQTMANTKNLIIMKSPTTTHPDASEYYQDFKKQMIKMMQEAKSIGQPQTRIEISEENKEHLIKFKAEIESQLIKSIYDIEQQIKTQYLKKMGQHIRQHPINPLFKNMDKSNQQEQSNQKEQKDQKAQKSKQQTPNTSVDQIQMEENVSKRSNYVKQDFRQKIQSLEFQDLLQEIKQTIFIHDEILQKKTIIQSMSIINSVTPALTNAFIDIANLQRLDEVVMLINFFNQMESQISLKLVEDQLIKVKLLNVLEALLVHYKQKLNSFLLGMIIIYQEKWEQSFNGELQQPLQALSTMIKFINCIEKQQNYKQKLKTIINYADEYTYLEPNQIKQLVIIQEKFNNNFEIQDKHLSDIFVNTRNIFQNISQNKNIQLDKYEKYGEREILNINDIEIESKGENTQQTDENEAQCLAQQKRQQSQQLKMKNEIQELQKDKDNQKKILEDKQKELEKTKEDYKNLETQYSRLHQIQIEQTQKEEELKLLQQSIKKNKQNKGCCILI